MDLANYDLKTNAERGFAFNIIDPVTLVKTDMVFNVVGADSKAYRNARTETMRDIVKSEAKDFDNDESTARVISACVTGWEGMTENGKPVEFSKEKAFEVLNKYPWLLDQISNAVETRANFTKPVKNA